MSAKALISKIGMSSGHVLHFSTFLICVLTSEGKIIGKLGGCRP